MTSFVRLCTPLVWVAFAAFVVPTVLAEPPKPDAVITTSEDIHDHEGSAEDIHDHEGSTEDIHDHEGSTEDIHDHEEGAERLSDHHADSETLEGRVVESERLHGMGKLPMTSDERLEAAREKLRVARERHAHHAARAKAAAPAAADPDAPASSRSVENRYDHWTAPIDVAKGRIGVAQAAVGVWDESYAKMIQADYPRGDKRQELIDSRDQAKRRLASEEAALHRMIDQARKAGVPPGVLELHATDVSN
jgi:hypothetical protein